jgi:hypothetical protein
MPGADHKATLSMTSLPRKYFPSRQGKQTKRIGTPGNQKSKSSWDVLELKDKRVGPDLLGVTQKRERKWLARWLAEPEKMLAEKDPIIMVLYEKYNNVAMPNMRLNKLEVDSLIDYMDTESRRIEKAKKDAAVASAPGCCDLPKSIESGSSTTSVIICTLGLAMLLMVTVYRPSPKLSHNLKNNSKATTTGGLNEGLADE